MKKAKSGENNPMFGRHHSKETIQKIKAKSSGWHHTKEAIAKMRKAKLGTHLSDETKAKISKAFLGRKVSDETRRKMREAQLREKGSGWKGGIGNRPYPVEFDYNLKTLIRERDNNTCQLCGRTKKEEGRNLCVHHIDYVKENLDPKNLITLCNRCNGKVNVYRGYWMNHFTSKYPSTNKMLRLANMMNGLVYYPYLDVCYFQSNYGHHAADGYFRIDAVPFQAVIHLLKGGSITIVDATRKNKPLSDGLRFGVPTWCIVFNRALNFKGSRHIKVCGWQTPEMKGVALSSKHRSLVRTIRKLVKIYGYKKPAVIGENIFVECHQGADFDDKPKRLREIIEKEFCFS